MSQNAALAGSRSNARFPPLADVWIVRLAAWTPTSAFGPLAKGRRRPPTDLLEVRLWGFAIEQPANVEVGDIVVRPTAQA
jgi:hypothetical protein